MAVTSSFSTSVHLYLAFTQSAKEECSHPSGAQLQAGGIVTLNIKLLLCINKTKLITANIYKSS